MRTATDCTNRAEECRKLAKHQQSPPLVVSQFERQLFAHNLPRVGSTRGFLHPDFSTWRAPRCLTGGSTNRLSQPPTPGFLLSCFLPVMMKPTLLLGDSRWHSTLQCS